MGNMDNNFFPSAWSEVSHQMTLEGRGVFPASRCEHTAVTIITEMIAYAAAQPKNFRLF
jgi:hypothetical protein